MRIKTSNFFHLTKNRAPAPFYTSSFLVFEVSASTQCFPKKKIPVEWTRGYFWFFWGSLGGVHMWAQKGDTQLLAGSSAFPQQLHPSMTSMKIWRWGRDTFRIHQQDPNVHLPKGLFTILKINKTWLPEI